MCKILLIWIIVFSEVLKIPELKPEFRLHRTLRKKVKQMLSLNCVCHSTSQYCTQFGSFGLV